MALADSSSRRETDGDEKGPKKTRADGEAGEARASQAPRLAVDHATQEEIPAAEAAAIQAKGGGESGSNRASPYV